METCKTCRFWEPKDKYNGVCKEMGFRANVSYVPLDCVDFFGSHKKIFGPFNVYFNFGCIHHEHKDKAVKDD